MATCARDSARRATPAGTPLRSTQAGARHRERAELVFFFPSSPLISAIAVLSSSSSSSSSPSTTHHRSPSASVADHPPLATVPSPALPLCSVSLSPSSTPMTPLPLLLIFSFVSAFVLPLRSPRPSATVAPCSLFTPPPAFCPHLPCVSLPPSSHPSIIVALRHRHCHRHPPLHCVAERHRRSLVSPPQPPSPSSLAPPPSANCHSLPLLLHLRTSSAASFNAFSLPLLCSSTVDVPYRRGLDVVLDKLRHHELPLPASPPSPFSPASATINPLSPFVLVWLGEAG